VTLEPKRVVREGYDRIAERYGRWGPGDDRGVKAKYIQLVRTLVPPGGRLLDLGCGTGGLVTWRLAEEFEVIGVDISPRSVAIAKTAVPAARFVVGDMSTVAFRDQVFAAVTAFFSLIHVPRREHRDVLASVHGWLSAGGLFVATMGAGPGGEGVDQFLGTPMYWSSWDAETNLQLVVDAGFEIISAVEETEDEENVPVTHLWVVAKRP
jgi:ubiquinone/menaquinone biosynthesis C-methylase UbiE